MTVRRLVTASALIALLGVAVLYGRAEGRSAVRNQQRQLDRLRKAVGPRLLRPGFTTYDGASGLTCLIYAARGRSLGLELCFDPQGRLVEAVDRRTPNERIASLRWDPASAPSSIAPSLLRAVLARVPPRLGLVP